MPRCVVNNCINNSEDANNDRIDYHSFPYDDDLRIAWIQVLDVHIDLREPKPLVCGQHFDEDSFFIDSFGNRLLHPTVVPCVFSVCNICSSFDRRVYSMSEDLKLAYKHLTGQELLKHHCISEGICGHCIWMLRKFILYKANCLKTQTELTNFIARNHNIITLKTLKEHSNNVKRYPNLTSKYNSINHFDCHIISSKENEYSDSELETVTQDVIKEIKNENIILDNTIIEDNGATQYNYTNTDEIDNEKDEIDDNDNEPEQFDNQSEESDNEDNIPIKKLKLDKASKLEIELNDLKNEDNHKKEIKTRKKRKSKHNDGLDPNVIVLTQLTEEEQISEMKDRRKSSNFKNCEFKCDKCFKGFADKDTFERHCFRHTDASGLLTCNICELHYSKASSLREHITSHNRKYSCQLCDYVTRRRTSAVLHQHYHDGKTYTCPHCPEIFDKPTTYFGHIKRRHSSDHICIACGESFVSHSGLQYHTSVKHLQFDELIIPEDAPRCVECDVTFISLAAKERHLRVSSKHSKMKPTVRRSQRPRTSPIQEHTGPIPCELCDIQLSTRREYFYHFRRTHPNRNRTFFPASKNQCQPVMCELCGKFFQSPARLRDHAWLHTQHKPFSCTLCGKRFQRRQNLYCHKRIHSERKGEFPCELCGKDFSTFYNRQRHMMIHTGERPYKCEICSKGFKILAEKRTHIAHVHYRQPWPRRRRREKPRGHDEMADTGDVPDDGWVPHEHSDIILNG